MMHLVSCYYAYVTHHDQYSSAREMNIAVRDVDGFQIFLNMFQFSSFCCWEYRVSLYSLCFKGEFQRYFEGFYMCFSDLSCVWSQLNTKYKTWQLIRNPRGVFRLLTSDFRLPTSNFRLPWQLKAVVGLHDFYLMPKCCLFQFSTFTWRYSIFHIWGLPCWCTGTYRKHGVGFQRN